MDLGNGDYRVGIKIRNARILRAITKAGHTPGPKLAEMMGIGVTAFYDLINLRTHPWRIKRGYRKRQTEIIEGEFSDAVLKFAEFLKVSPFDLFSVEQLQPLATNAAEFDLSAQQITALLDGREEHDEIALPDVAAESGELKTAVRKHIAELSPREQKVLALRFGIDCNEQSLDELAEIFGVTRERIRQIEAKAIRKLRHPNHSQPLLEHYE